MPLHCNILNLHKRKKGDGAGHCVAVSDLAYFHNNTEKNLSDM
jgi:hypothetical protein